jgi:hypothetical protein
MLGLPGVLVETLDIFEFDVFVGLLAYSIPANAMWGSIYGIVYSKFYDRVPSKGIKKGFVWGCIIAFISNIMIALSPFLLFLFTGMEPYFVSFYSWAETGLVIWVTYGIFLGIIYERWK